MTPHKIPQAWYDEKMRDGAASQEQCTTLIAYLDLDLSAEDAAEALTTPVHQAATAVQDRTEDEVDELCNLWGIIIDLVVEWRVVHPQILRLLYAISRLPAVERTGKDSLGTLTDDAGVLRELELWRDLPRFWTLLSDSWDSLAAWRNKAVSSPETTDVGENGWTCINAFAALALSSPGSFQGMNLLSDWGRLALDWAVQGGPETSFVDVPVAAAYFALAGADMLRIHGEHRDRWLQAFEGIAKAADADTPVCTDAMAIVARLSEA